MTLPTINRMSSKDIKIHNGFYDVFYITNTLFALTKSLLINVIVLNKILSDAFVRVCARAIEMTDKETYSLKN